MYECQNAKGLLENITAQLQNLFDTRDKMGHDLFPPGIGDWAGHDADKFNKKLQTLLGQEDQLKLAAKTLTGELQSVIDALAAIPSGP